MTYNVTKGQVYSDKHSRRGGVRKFEVIEVDTALQRADVQSFTTENTGAEMLPTTRKNGKKSFIKLSRFKFKYYKLETETATKTEAQSGYTPRKQTDDRGVLLCPTASLI